jgi:hypothetical protein
VPHDISTFGTSVMVVTVNFTNLFSDSFAPEAFGLPALLKVFWLGLWFYGTFPFWAP